MDLWLPGYEHQPVPGAGLSVSPGRPKVVLHTTETDRPSLNTLINHWRRNWGAGLPHFGVEGTRVVQLLPLNVGAYTLENAPGGADTNRSGPAVQAEVVSRADTDWDDPTYQSVGMLLADIKRAGHDFDLGTYPRFWGANEGVILASYSSPIRMSAAEYVSFNGWTDHAHCPENAHWDIGKKDGKRLERIARAHFAPVLTPEEEALVAGKSWARNGTFSIVALDRSGTFRVDFRKLADFQLAATEEAKDVPPELAAAFDAMTPTAIV